MAFFLQNDNTGCQSGMYRLTNSQVLFWHSEEDTSNTVDKPRVLNYRWHQQPTYSFIYPSLLSGSAFTWNKNLIFFINYLSVIKPIVPGLLANTASWVIFDTALEIKPEQVLKNLMPFVDGYAFNFVYPANSINCAYKIEFLKNKLLKTDLPKTPHQFLLQTNIVSNRHSLLINYEQSKDLVEMKARLSRMEHFFATNKKKPLSRIKYYPKNASFYSRWTGICFC